MSGNPPHFPSRPSEHIHTPLTEDEEHLHCYVADDSASVGGVTLRVIVVTIVRGREAHVVRDGDGHVERR